MFTAPKYAMPETRYDEVSPFSIRLLEHKMSWFQPLYHMCYNLITQNSVTENSLTAPCRNIKTKFYFLR